MMQLASDTMYQAGTKTLLDLVVQQNSSNNVYQVRNDNKDDNIFSTSSRMWVPSPSLSSGTEPTGLSSAPATPTTFSTYSLLNQAGFRARLSPKRTKRYPVNWMLIAQSSSSR